MSTLNSEGQGEAHGSAPGGMQGKLIAGIDAFEQLANVWDELAGRAMTATPFQKLAYQRAWWRHLGPGELFTIAVDGEDGAVCAIGCFFLVDGVLYFNGCVEETDYLDLITTAEEAEGAWRAVLAVLESDSFPAWRSLSLCNVPQDSPSRAILAGLTDERGYAFSAEKQEVCPIIELPGSFDDYLMALDKKQRHEVRRKLRKAKGAGAELSQVADRAQLHEAVDEFLRLLRLSTVEKDGWLNEERRAVFHEVAAAAFDDGSLQLLFLQQQGKNAAALFNFDYKGRIWVYNSGMDIVEFGKLSPGVVLTAGAIELAIAAGRHTFDFLRGDEEYKYRFGARDTHIYHLQLDRA